MRQYELAIRIAQVHHLVDERKYKKALAVIQTLDMRQVRALSDLRIFAEVYTKTEQYDAAKATYLRIYRRSHTKRVLYRLIYLSIRTNALNDAEAYYQEFVRMNPNVRDALILRYRIDKAAGEPISRLIEILQELKQEEYIEEWAYELAKLYHRAGRKEDCKDECQDIILWFGTGEIVERAKILIEHLEEKDGNLYYDDRDFTVPKKEEPNPEDTGSLPDLNEFVKGRKARRMAERLEESNAAETKQEAVSADGKAGGKSSFQTAESAVEKQDGGKQTPFPAEDFVDDYEDDDFGEEMDLSQKAKDGIHKLSGLLKLGKKEEDADDAPAHEHPGKEKKEGQQADFTPKTGEEKIGFVPHSQSGMGITQDLAKEIAAIYEMEQREQLKEKTVTVIQDTSNLAANVVERMTQAVQKNIGRTYIPLDIEEIQPEDKTSEKSSQEAVEEEMQQASVPEEHKEDEISEMPPEENREEDSPEVMAEGDKEDEVPEMPSEENEEENSLEVSLEEDGEESFADINEEEMRERALTKMLEEEVAEIQKNISQETGTEDQKYITEEEVKETNRQDTETLKSLLEEEIEEPESQTAATMDELVSPEIKSVEPAHMMAEEPQFPEREVLAEEAAVPDEQEIETEETSALDEQEIEAGEVSAPDEQEIEAEEASAPDEQEMETEEAAVPDEQEIEMEETSAPDEQEMEAEEASAPDEQEMETEEVSASDEQEMEAEEASVSDEEEILTEEVSVSQEQASALAGYQAPDIPVVETSFMEMPEITYDELPTTRALQQSFKNVLKLIAGERDPSHFVLMGDGRERIVGVSKQIVRVMKEAGYLSQGRIAKIHAGQINKMDLISFRSQLKGNCLLVEGASDLLFPTITRLFSIMEEYYGDFVVILVDEGTTLDQLFRFVPALAKKFKYIIDISQYTPEDYQ